MLRRQRTPETGTRDSFGNGRSSRSVDAGACSVEQRDEQSKRQPGVSILDGAAELRWKSIIESNFLARLFVNLSADLGRRPDT